MYQGENGIFLKNMTNTWRGVLMSDLYSILNNLTDDDIRLQLAFLIV